VIRPIRVLLLFGPTAVGKTDLLVRLFSGRGEIISADSMQVYRGMDIGTAKPDPEVLTRLPHHLIDIKDPHEQYNAGEFVHAADRIVPEIDARGRIPVVSGGTAFYFRNFIYGLPESPPGDEEVRNSLRVELEAEGPDPLYRELERVDPDTAGRISRADTYRILRALEVHRVTGRPLSDFAVREKPRELYEFLVLGLDRPREELYRRIDRRVETMFAEGLLHEFKGLLGKGYGRYDPGLKAIGYREFFEMREEGCPSLADIRDRIMRNTRRFAKRQITFFKRMPGIRWFHPEDEEGLRREVTAFLAKG
jgi:tRNA dimethylallyltransferase